MDIDVQGAEQVRACQNDLLSRCYADVYIHVPQDELKSRLCSRGTDRDEVIALRLRNVAQEDICLPLYQYCLVSSDKESDYKSFSSLLEALSMRTSLYA
jgi:guanylate kinase